MTPDDRLVAGVRAELDALLPVLAEEVAAAVAVRHGVAVPHDVAPVIAALRGLRSLDDPSVERVVLGALGHPVEGADMPAEQKPTEEKKPTEAPWYDECSPEVTPLADFAVGDAGHDVSALIKGALQVDHGRYLAEAVLTVVARIKSGRFDPEFARCSKADRVEIARRALCVEDEARTYVATKADPVAFHVLSRGRQTPAETRFNAMVRLAGIANATGREADHQRAETAAVVAHRTIAFHTTLYHWFLVHDGLATLARLRETVELIGDPVEVIAAYTGRDPSHVFDLFARHEAVVDLVDYLASGGKDRGKLVRVGLLHPTGTVELAHGA